MERGPGLMLHIDRLDFGGQPLFQDFGLTVPAGEVVALIGPSGVGKTTLLRILAGVETGFQGQALVDGQPATRAPVPGLVFQDARLLPWARAEDNLRLVLPDATQDDIDGALADVGLSGVNTLWPRQLSGGMQRRLGLARALLVNPMLLLLDEPFVSLDRMVVRELQALLDRLIAARSATAVMVSHDPEDAARLAHRAVLIAGRPVRILADIALPGPPHNRSRAEIGTLAERIETTLSEGLT